MPKLFFTCFYLVLFFSITADAQGFWQYKSEYTENYSLASMEINQGYFERADKIFLWIKNAGELQKFIEKGFANKVFAVKLDLSAADELPKSIALLTEFGKLNYISLNITATADTSKTIKLPAEIEKLQQVEGIEFNTARIDMDDAFNKLAGLKNLHIISFSGYTAQLPPSIGKLTQLDSVKLNTTNIGNNNLTGVHWKKVHVEGDPVVWHETTSEHKEAEEKALLNLASITTLRQVNFDDILMTNPSVIKKFTQVDDLRMILESKDDPTAFLTALSTLTNLHTLYLDLLDGESISIGWLKNLTQLKDLYLSGMDKPFKDFEALGELTKLESLTLHQCSINPLPDIFGKLTHLKRFSLSLNGTTTLPTGLFNLPELESLDLLHDGITALPDLTSYGCTKLKHIDLTWNELTTLPKAISNLMQLETIDCRENKIETVPGGWEYFKNLREVNFASNRLKEFPEGLQNNHNVERINLSFNGIEAFPDVEGEGFRLKYLGIISNHQLFELPEHIGSYTELETLEAERTHLESLPQSLGNCKQLKTLLLTASIAGRTTLPAGLKDAKYLEVLQLNDDPLLDHQSIFDVMLSQPRPNFRVSLESDEITELPATDKWLTIPFLYISLRNNPITEFPPQFINSKVKGQVTMPDGHIGFKP